MATVPAATPITPAGINMATLATNAALSQTFANNGKILVAIKNGSGASINATFVATKVVNDGGGNLSLGNRVVAVAAGATLVIGPFPTEVFNDSAQEVTLQISAITTVTLQAYSVN